MTESRCWSWRSAITRSGLPATTRHILHVISFYMNEHGTGSYPSQETIARETGYSRKAVNEHIQKAIETGWLKVHQHGCRGRKWRRNEYVASWPERKLDAPGGGNGGLQPSDQDNPLEGGPDVAKRPENKGFSGDGDHHGEQRETEGSNGGLPPHEDVTLSAGGCNPDGVEVVTEGYTNPPVNPPGIPPVERGGAQARDHDSGLEDLKTQTPKQIEKSFRQNFSKWPTYLHDSETEARKAWITLTDAERDMVDERLDEYLESVNRLGRSRHCAFSVFLREKRIARLQAKEGSAPATGQVPAAPWGKLWNAARLSVMLTEPRGNIPQPPQHLADLFEEGGESGLRRKAEYIARHSWPKINAMLERARNGMPSSVPVALERIAERFDKCPTDSAVWQAWVELHRVNKWPLPPSDTPKWVWMPVSANPDDYSDPAEFVAAALAEFEAALDAMTSNVGVNEEAGDDDCAA